ncbi:MAG: outer membrane lipoprotein LolB [Chromatiaceae bacterium]|nr:MAG: outer membrane lipoprotein LolB [Chromatiaceae bacterium]
MMRLITICLAAALLAACAVRPPEPVEDVERTWQQRLEVLSARDDWVLAGRVAVAVDEERWNANLRWRQDGEAYDIQIYGPFGRHAARLRGDASGVTLTDSEGRDHHARDADQLVYDTLGWRLPVNGLRYWVLGIPAPGGSLEAYALDPAGRPEQLAQSGWTVRYQRYSDESRPPLPDRMTLEFDDIRVRVLMDDWQMNP